MSYNCQVQTPDEFVLKMLDYIDYKHELYGKSVLENSCGKGNILIRIVERYIADAKSNEIPEALIIKGLEKDITGYEIDDSSICECKKKLDKVAERFGLFNVKWNILKYNYLKTSKEKYDYIIGNPPYITYHDLTEAQRKLLKTKFSTCKEGRCDYYYAFVEKSINSLNENGKLVYLIPFSIFRNKYAQALRDYIKDTITDVYDFTGIQLFSGVVISSTIILCQAGIKRNSINYHKEINGELEVVKKDTLNDKWFFVQKTNKGERFGDFFSVHNGVATLLNEAFLICDYIEDNEYIYVGDMKIEKEILRPAVSTKTMKRKSVKKRDEKIIFPYKLCSKGYIKYEQKEFEEKFPEAYKYLKSFYDKLNKRKSDEKAQWFEYGRSQAIAEIKGEKLIFPMVFTNKVKVYKCNSNAVPYAGYFLKKKDHSRYTLDDAKKILQSEKFYEYIKEHGTPTTATSYRMSTKEIESYLFEGI